MHVPVVCGDSEEIQRYLKDNDFELESVSVGREGANKDGRHFLFCYIFYKQR